eukprot:TRINITY_DN5121_c0_g1_i1.p1 TRINITY_DN5121_c0_g1~~TRINITY_DN5121_c0_g1_i1.p1  ORF type:complete len:863 (+),score=203.18 TRINITY_DN5121_c0_g1_i1:226-2814(+)
MALEEDCANPSPLSRIIGEGFLGLEERTATLSHQGSIGEDGPPPGIRRGERLRLSSVGRRPCGNTGATRLLTDEVAVEVRRLRTLARALCNAERRTPHDLAFDTPSRRGTDATTAAQSAETEGWVTEAAGSEEDGSAASPSPGASPRNQDGAVAVAYPAWLHRQGVPNGGFMVPSDTALSKHLLASVHNIGASLNSTLDALVARVEQQMILVFEEHTERERAAEREMELVVRRQPSSPARPAASLQASPTGTDRPMPLSISPRPPPRMPAGPSRGEAKPAEADGKLLTTAAASFLQCMADAVVKATAARRGAVYIADREAGVLRCIASTGSDPAWSGDVHMGTERSLPCAVLHSGVAINIAPKGPTVTQPAQAATLSVPIPLPTFAPAAPGAQPGLCRGRGACGVIVVYDKPAQTAPAPGGFDTADENTVAAACTLVGAALQALPPQHFAVRNADVLPHVVALRRAAAQHGKARQQRAEWATDSATCDSVSPRRARSRSRSLLRSPTSRAASQVQSPAREVALAARGPAAGSGSGVQLVLRVTKEAAVHGVAHEGLAEQAVQQELAKSNGQDASRRATDEAAELRGCESHVETLEYMWQKSMEEKRVIQTALSEAQARLSDMACEMSIVEGLKRNIERKQLRQQQQQQQQGMCKRCGKYGPGLPASRVGSRADSRVSRASVGAVSTRPVSPVSLGLLEDRTDTPGGAGAPLRLPPALPFSTPQLLHDPPHAAVHEITDSPVASVEALVQSRTAGGGPALAFNAFARSRTVEIQHHAAVLPDPPGAPQHQGLFPVLPGAGDDAFAPAKAVAQPSTITAEELRRYLKPRGGGRGQRSDAQRGGALAELLTLPGRKHRKARGQRV